MYKENAGSPVFIDSLYHEKRGKPKKKKKRKYLLGIVDTTSPI